MDNKRELIVSYVNNNDVGAFNVIVMGTVEAIGKNLADDQRTPLIESHVQVLGTIDPNKVGGAFRTGKASSLPLVSFQF